MKKALVAIILVVALGALVPAEAVSKPAYCYTALRACYSDCADLFSSDLARSACYLGCLIGYANCG